MKLYEVVWDNGEMYEDHMENSKIFSTLELAQAYYDKQTTAYSSFSTETVSIYEFSIDVMNQVRTKLFSKVLDVPFDEE